SAAALGPVSVPFSIGGTATVTDDYTTTAASPLVFPIGVTSKDITVTVVDDDLHENNETVSVTLSAPTGGGGTLGSPATQVVTIVDNDPEPTVDFAADSSSVNETGSATTITVSLSKKSGLPVTVPFGVGGSALNPGDYTITASPVTIPPLT